MQQAMTFGAYVLDPAEGEKAPGSLSHAGGAGQPAQAARTALALVVDNPKSGK